MRWEAVRRRTVLLGALAGAAVVGAGCREHREQGWHPRSITPEASAVLGAIAVEQRLLDHCEALREEAMDEEDETLLTSAADAHQRHLTALRERLPADTPATTDPSGETAPPERPTETTATPPSTDDGGSRSALRVAAEDAATTHLRRAGQVTDPGLAQLLASLGAAAAGYAQLLAEGR
ncbi:hypothetical protein RIF23_09655 [Lipingzhangella sp. LS1_29]|uniref:DUF305 domain-containing protein n=1 Tax=Lipingzhangella rawalii TaxID=2055835 RepID=A0ABU2H5J3_9ACTN|nr:hypothetical protein [Lipingzhangella rawalii]MDS1270561.1 hypothetical protein [Lipingzhangella rawalii]